ncbi:RNA-guided endonuclease TnpB family protein, partial [Alicyclobacillus herbarius]|uniref:RNA-guided endonuclease TnpB family protein n=1 Tax=Alicyclobacillus herbarius TaxID=122960 RepID=UPI000554E620
NRKLARAISDTGWGEFRRMLAYKCTWYGSTLTVVPRFYASSKTCSVCGHVLDELPLSVREWTCPTCNTHHDRDVNAARNLLKFSTASSAGIHACGESSGGAATRR